MPSALAPGPWNGLGYPPPPPPESFCFRTRSHDSANGIQSVTLGMPSPADAVPLGMLTWMSLRLSRRRRDIFSTRGRGVH